MKKSGKSDCDPNSELEQDLVSETGTLSGTQDSDIVRTDFITVSTHTLMP